MTVAVVAKLAKWLVPRLVCDVLWAGGMKFLPLASLLLVTACTAEGGFMLDSQEPVGDVRDEPVRPPTPTTPPDGPVQPPAHPIASGQVGAHGLAAGELAVFWANDPSSYGDGAVVRSTLPDGNPVPITGPARVDDITVGTRYVYWIDPLRQAVVRARHTAAEVEPVARDLGELVAIDAHGDLIALATGRGGIFLIDGDNDTVTPLARFDDRPTGIAFDGDHVYWTTDRGYVLRVPVAGGELEVVAKDQDVPFGLVEEGKLLFWASPSRRELVVAGKRPDVAPVVLAGQQFGLSGLAVHRGFVYFTTLSDGAVKRVHASGGQVELLWHDLSAPTELAAVDGHVYWIDDAEAAVIRGDLQ